MIVNKIYQNCIKSGNWELLRSTRAELISPKTIDFSITEQKEKNYLRTALKIIFLPWLIYEAIRYVAQRLMMTQIYPAQSTLVKALIPEFRTNYLDAMRLKDVEDLTQKGFIVRHVTFERNGRQISGILITHPEHANNGKWALQATGNIQPIELGLSMIGDFYHSQKYNVLMLNNPGVGRSEGTATPETIGETQEAGIQFLESVIKAKKLILAGFSMGGGAMSQAIMQHKEFKKDINYIVIRQMSYDKISNVAKHILNFHYAPALIQWGDCEINSLHASRKLQQLGIPEVIIQSTDDKNQPIHDGAIPGPATLQSGIQSELDIDETKKFIGLYNAGHMDDRIKDATAESIHFWDRPATLWNRFTDCLTQFIDNNFPLQPV